jgi:hypothetical protein
MEVSGITLRPVYPRETIPPSTVRITGCVGPKDGSKTLGKKNVLAHIHTNCPTFSDAIFMQSLNGIFPKAN